MTDAADAADVDPGADVARARDLALRSLAGAPRTRAQLEQFLARRDVDAGTAAQVLDGLERAGVVDDAAFARAWVDGRRGSRGLSRARLSRELADRGIPEDAAEAALASIDADADADSALDLAETWVARHGMAGDRDRARLFAYLARRGYGPEVAGETVRAVSSDAWEDAGLLGE